MTNQTCDPFAYYKGQVAQRELNGSEKEKILGRLIGLRMKKEKEGDLLLHPPN